MKGPFPVAGEDWQDTLRTYLVTIWETTRRYPGLGAYMINQPGLGVTSERLQAGVAFFEDAGFPPAQARLAWSFATTYIHGRISVDAHLGHKPDAPHLDGLKARDYVEFGVGAVLAGLEAILDGAAPALVGAGTSSSTRAGTRSRKRKDG